jgi:SAM-dependent methyltransferase
MDEALPERDTDADWREIGASEPFWGVLTHSKFRRDNLSEENLAAFYASGADYVDYVAMWRARIVGGPAKASLALDFGCGVGRLTEAMCAHADSVIGYDISPGMLEEARRRSAGKAVYTSEFPKGPFDWINSYIVFQHIPPERGYKLVEDLLTRVAFGGFVSLEFNVYSDPSELPSLPDTAREDELVAKQNLWRRFLHVGARRVAAAPEPTPEPAPPLPLGTVIMYDYDLNRLCAMFHRSGIERLLLEHEDHGGHHGVRIFGRREA